MTKRKATGNAAARRPAVRVHGRGDAMRAAAVAHELGVPITLVSAPYAAASMGPAWFRNIVREVEQAYPGLDVEAELDCGDAAGYVLAALRAGVRIVRFSGKPSAATKLEDIAGTYGARLVRRPGQILDARQEPDAETALRKWLEGK